MDEEITIKEIVSLLIKEDLRRIDKTLYIGPMQLSIKAYRIGVKLFRIDVEDVNA